MSDQLSRRTLLALGASLPIVGALTSSPAAAASAATPRPEVAVPAGASAFASVTPARLADTRPDKGIGGYSRVDAHTIRVVVAGRGNVPANAAAAVLNLTVVNTTLAGYISVYPAGGSLPLASSVNIEEAGQVIANLVTVRLGAGGAVDIYTQNATDDLVVDVNGAYVPVADAVKTGRFVGLDKAARVLDTRTRNVKVAGNVTERVSLAAAVPATATAVVVNLTVTQSDGPGYITGFAAGGAAPASSSVNTDAANQTRANQAILPVGLVNGSPAIDVYASSGTHLVVDVAGYFTGATDAASIDGLFVPNAPYRTLDTRTVTKYGRMYAGWIAEFDYTGRPQSQAVVVNLTTSDTRGAGYFTGYPARTERPLASNLNASYSHQTIANHAILRTSNAGVAVYTQTGGNLIVDVAGYFIGSPTVGSLSAPVNIVPPPPPPSPLPYILSMLRAGRTGTIVEGVSSPVVDAGYVGHWPGTGFAGENSHMVLFAHRTEHGGIFRNVHLFVPGDEIAITGSDGRVFHYGYFQRDITNSSAANIYNVGLVAPIPSVSIVGCSKTNFLPTDVKYRIVVTFTLLRVDND